MTKKFGIIGDPIKHSLSPVLHNYWFKKYDIDAEYSIIQVRENQIPKIVNEIRKRELTGINITLPYKQKIVPHVDLLINDAEVTGSVNTLYCNDNEKIVGENTDVFGLQAAYLKELDKKEESGELDKLPKQEAASLRRKHDKLRQNLGGLREMKQIPDIAIVVDPKRESTAIAECRKLGIPIISILDTNCDPNVVDIPIPANDDAIRSIKLIISTLSDAIILGQKSM